MFAVPLKVSSVVRAPGAVNRPHMNIIPHLERFVKYFFWCFLGTKAPALAQALEQKAVETRAGHSCNAGVRLAGSIYCGIISW